MRFNFWKKQSMFPPAREFHAKAKERYLAAFDACYPETRPLQVRSQFMLAVRGVAALLVVALGLLGGGAVYADTTNVSADNPLYSLKRMSESIKLAVATQPVVRSELEATYAARRANEIAYLEARNPSSTLIDQLATDLDDSFDASIGVVPRKDDEAIENSNASSSARSAGPFAAPQSMPQDGENGRDGQSSSTIHGIPGGTDNEASQGKEKQNEAAAAVCAQLKPIFDVSSSIVRSRLSEGDGTSAKARFEKRCGKVGDSGNDGEGQNANTSSSVDIGASASGTLSAPTSTMPFRQDQENKDRGDERSGGGNASSGTNLQADVNSILNIGGADDRGMSDDQSVPGASTTGATNEGDRGADNGGGLKGGR